MIKKVFIKLALFFFICMGIVTLVLIYAGNTVDFFYEKFTTPDARSMIIGDSRSMQGIQPRVFNTFFQDSDVELPMFNYSFTIAQAPIGPLYNKSIEKKLNLTTKNGLFVISVTPWMFGSEKENNNEEGEFREKGQPPHNMQFVSVNPNYEYFIKNLNFFHFKGAFRKNTILHKDGWLEELNISKDRTVFDQWKKNQIMSLERMQKKYKVSDVRLKNLDSLIKKLKLHGEVYVVRMPIDYDFVEVEERFYNGFNRDMDLITKSNDIPYINFNTMNNHHNFKTYDGHHLDKTGGAYFSKVLCDSIQMYRSKGRN